jgi:hypothetical protein
VEHFFGPLYHACTLIQITKSKLFLAARGVQLDNGVTPPVILSSTRHTQ